MVKYFFLIHFISLAAFAKSETFFKQDYGMTSDSFRQHSSVIGYNSDRFDIFWPHSDEKESGDAYQIQVENLQGNNQISSYRAQSLLVGKKFKLDNTKSFAASVGHNFLQAEDEKRNLSLFSLSAFCHPDKDIMAVLMIDRNSMAQDLSLTGSFTEGFHYNRLTQVFQKKMGESHRVREQFQQYGISDHNQKRDLDLSWLYGVSQFPNWIWVGLGAEYLTYDKKTLAYWSPSKFWAAGLRFDLSVPVVYEDLFLKLGGSLNTSKEEDLSSSSGHFAKLALTKGSHEDHQLEISATDIRSEQSGNNWSSQIYSLSALFVF